MLRLSAEPLLQRCRLSCDGQSSKEGRVLEDTSQLTSFPPTANHDVGTCIVREALICRCETSEKVPLPQRWYCIRWCTRVWCKCRLLSPICKEQRRVMWRLYGVQCRSAEAQQHGPATLSPKNGRDANQRQRCVSITCIIAHTFLTTKH